MGYIAENIRRFFHPAAIDEMLSTFLPMMNGTSLNVSTAQWPRLSGVDAFHVEHPRLTILYVDFPAAITSSILSSHALPSLGVHQLLHVRRPHAPISCAAFGDSCRPYRE